jgi:hypothetical protein
MKGFPWWWGVSGVEWNGMVRLGGEDGLQVGTKYR